MGLEDQIGKAVAAMAVTASIEDSVRITLTKMTPIPKDKQEEDGPYFEDTKITVPAKGIQIESIDPEYVPNSEHKQYTPEQFDHLPKSVTLGRYPNPRNYSNSLGYGYHSDSKLELPSAKVTTLDGESFLIHEFHKRAEEIITKNRKAVLESIPPVKINVKFDM